MYVHLRDVIYGHFLIIPSRFQVGIHIMDGLITYPKLLFNRELQFAWNHNSNEVTNHIEQQCFGTQNDVKILFRL